MRSFFLDFTNVIMSCHLRQFLSDTHAVEVSPVPEDCNMNPLHIGIMLYTVMINDHYHYHCNAFCLSHLRNAPSWMLLMGLFDKSRSLLHFCISFFVFLFFCIFFVRHIQIPVQQGENGQWWWLWIAVILVIESRLLLDDENLGGGLNNGFGDLDNNLSWGMWEKEYPGINLRLLWLKT